LKSRRQGRLVDTLRAFGASPADCARRLAAGAADLTASQAVLEIRAALALGVLDRTAGRRLAVALEALAGDGSASPELPEIEALEARIVELEKRYEESLAKEKEMARLQGELARLTVEIDGYKATSGRVSALLAAARDRRDMYVKLLAEVTLD
jgi:hypothetical protein